MTIYQKVWQLLTSKFRRKAIILLVLMLIGMLLETLGIGLVIPALALMTQSDLIARYPAVEPVLAFLGYPSHERLVIGGMLIFVGVYAIKAVFLAFLAWQQSSFVYGFQASLSQRIFAGYLRQPYTFHLQRNSAQLIRNVTGEVSILVTVAKSVLMLLTEGFVLLGITILLLSVESLGAILVITVVALSGWVFYRFSRKHLKRWGEERQHHEGLRIQHLQQGLGGVKDVKILGREDEFLSQYEYHNNVSAHVGQRYNALQQFPRLWLELLAVMGLATLVLVMIARDNPLDTLLPTIGVFAAAAFRLMPSINRVLGAIQGLRYSAPVINTLYNEVQQFVSIPQSTINDFPSLNRSLCLDQVCFKYPSVQNHSLQDVNIDIACGTSVGFVGGSGAGKSTLVDIILGLLTPTSGTVKVDGIDIQSNMRGWQDQFGYVPQSIYLTDDSLRRNIAFGLPSDQIDEDVIWRAIRAAQLESFVKDLPQGLDTIVGERGIRLSGGQRQRIGIARALYHDPAVLVLDEATSSLDSNTERGVMEAVYNLRGKKTVLIVAHRLSTVEHCDRLYRLESGKVIAGGTPSELLSNYQ